MRPDTGLITLEWLLIIGAIAAIAASSVLAAQRVVDDTTDIPDDPVVRVLDADITAALIAAEAQTAHDASRDPSNPTVYDTTVDNDFKQRCEALAGSTQFGDVLSGTPSWQGPDVGPDGNHGTNDDVAARCTVTPQADLGG